MPIAAAARELQKAGIDLEAGANAVVREIGRIEAAGPVAGDISLSASGDLSEAAARLLQARSAASEARAASGTCTVAW